jgi:hypothetical protein
MERPDHNAGERSSKTFSDGGYVMMAQSNSSTWGVLRFANFRFRPSQADVLHLDIWAKGANLIRDAGTFSYHDDDWLTYFPGTRAHNTCEFDNRDQMPRLSRFLFSDWLHMEEIRELSMKDSSCCWYGRYCDYRGAVHGRSVVLDRTTWSITDTLQGYERLATLRWRLAPGQWRLADNLVIGERASLQIEVDGDMRRIELVDGWESRYYHEITNLPVLETEVGPGGARITTTIRIGL